MEKIGFHKQSLGEVTMALFNPRRLVVPVFMIVLGCYLSATPKHEKHDHLRQITIENNHHVYAGILRKLIPLKDGRRFDPALLQLGVNKIRDAYQGFGYVEVACTPEVLRNQDGTISVIVSVNEGEQFFISSVNAIGKSEADLGKELEQWPSLQRGQIYNEHLAELFFRTNAPATLKNVPPRARMKLVTDSRSTVAVTFDFRDK